MTDIVERLSYMAHNSGPATASVCADALSEIERLRALAQPAASGEPVAWAQLGMRNGHTYVRMHYEGHLYPPPPDVQRNLNLVPLYATAQTAPAPPVATVRRAHAGGRMRSIGYQVCDLLPGANVQDGTMLYAAPQPAPARAPLTDERLNAAGLDYALADSFSSSKAEWVAQDIADAFKAGARAAERHHGITAPGAPDAPSDSHTQR